MIINYSIVNCVSDADLCNKISVIPYATNPRSVVTVGDMMDNHFGIYDVCSMYPSIINKPTKIMMGSLYGKMGDKKMKGMIIDEFA